MINDIKKNTQDRMIKSLDLMRRDLGAIRTGQALPNILENIPVPAWGSELPLCQVASITVEDARTLKVDIYDKSLFASVEKAILASGLGLNPINTGTSIRVPMLALSEEARRAAESARLMVGTLRQAALDELKTLAETKKISEDEQRPAADELQTLADKFLTEINKALNAKEKELMAF